jgi:hypothetical protein
LKPGRPETISNTVSRHSKIIEAFIALDLFKCLHPEAVITIEALTKPPETLGPIHHLEDE